MNGRATRLEPGAHITSSCRPFDCEFYAAPLGLLSGQLLLSVFEKRLYDVVFQQAFQRLVGELQQMFVSSRRQFEPGRKVDFRLHDNWRSDLQIDEK